MQQQAHDGFFGFRLGYGGCSPPARPEPVSCPGLLPWDPTVRNPPRPPGQRENPSIPS